MVRELEGLATTASRIVSDRAVAKPFNDITPTLSDIKKIRLHLVRHGETVANRNGVLQGHCDYPLTSFGLEQAEACGYYLRDMKWDKIYASDLLRAYHTCQYVLEKSTYPRFKKVKAIEQTPLLRELSFGVREALPRSTPYEEAVRLTAERLGIPESEVVDTTESYEACMKRQETFIKSLFDSVALAPFKRSMGIDNDGSGGSSEEGSFNNNRGLSEVPRIEVKDDRRAAPRGVPKPPRDFSFSAALIDDAERDDGTIDNSSSSTEAIKPLNVLCLTHGHYIKQFLHNFCHVDVPAKIHNCAVTVVDVEWSDPSDARSYNIKAEGHWVNLNTYEHVMAGRGSVDA